jgi:hypothetical protein
MVSDAGLAERVKPPGTEIVSVSTCDEEPGKFISPLYTAVKRWTPGVSELVVYEAMPFTRVAGLGLVDVPGSGVCPSKNVTVPVGVGFPEAAAWTVAVKMIEVFSLALAFELVSVVADSPTRSFTVIISVIVGIVTVPDGGCPATV